MKKVWQTIKSLIWWTHNRGSVHYDVMVTLILLFLWLAPYKIDFHDKPAEHNLHHNEVVVNPDGHGGLVYEVTAAAVTGSDPAQIRAELLRVIEPISGEVELVRYEAVSDSRGRIAAYRVWAQR